MAYTLADRAMGAPSKQANAIVTLVRDAAEPGGRNLFSCRRSEWELLLELGRVFGWREAGATYLRAIEVRGASSATTEPPVRHGYQPGEACDQKRIEARDAAAWAAALDRARRFPQLAQLIAHRPADNHLSPEEQHKHFAAVLDEFIEYAYGGEFSFALSADGASVDGASS